MGYRSDVMCLVYPDTQLRLEDRENYAVLKTLMNTTFKDVLDEWGEDVEWIDGNHCLKFEIEDVKWYESYPQVQRFSEMVQFFKNSSPKYCVEFVRIGENHDDVEEEHHGDTNQYFLRVRRSIESDV